MAWHEAAVVGISFWPVMHQKLSTSTFDHCTVVLMISKIPELKDSQVLFGFVTLTNQASDIIFILVL